MTDPLTRKIRQREAKRFQRRPPPTVVEMTDETRDLLGSVAARLAPRFERPEPAERPGWLGGVLGRLAPGGRIGADRAGARVRVGCMMMQKDEDVLLDPWLRFHSWLFGAENLFVLDNGSTRPAVLERLGRAEADGVVVIREFREKAHFEDKGRLFVELVRRLEPVLDHDFFMPLDCDEFVGVMEPDGRVLCTPEAVTGYLGAEHLKDPRVLNICGSFYNIPGFPGWYTFQNEKKIFFAGGMVRKLAMGFHMGRARHSDEDAPTRIVHFHYRYRPYAQYVESSKMKLEGRVENFTAEEVRNSERSAGSHMARLAFVSEEEYAEHFARRPDRVPNNALQTAFARLGMDLPF
jgi:hypothetical protein